MTSTLKVNNRVRWKRFNWLVAVLSEVLMVQGHLAMVALVQALGMQMTVEQQEVTVGGSALQATVRHTI